jgi:hypothetical protein
VELAGLLELFKNHSDCGLAWIISEGVRHEEVVLAENIKLLAGFVGEEFDKIKEPRANPKFNLMMQTALDFFKANLP